ncbi:MAG: glycosyltransferase involved in cell wall biosynthesis [Patiriisocius sp.]|jgi:glycosyltransferase involved in cell wall biosynthesis
MFKNIPKYKKLLVISDTGILRTANGFKAFGPVVKELEYLLELFDEITWIGFEKLSQKENASYIDISSNKITPILIKDVGGNTLKAKLNILRLYPSMFILIRKEVKRHKFIHSRAPSNPAVIAMFLSFFFRNKKFWHKYAGTWIDNASFFYKVQRKFLKKLKNNSIITINGNFSDKKNIISFENPCLDMEDRALGKKIIKTKKIQDKIVFCFVGLLNTHKGVDKILEAFIQIDNYKKIDTLHFVGNGVNKIIFEKLSRNIKFNVVFHGFLPKNEIKMIYEKSHFILLPSKSEGFPKVIGEAMNYGCIPIVSDISCIGEYIKDNTNGYLLNPNTIEVLKIKISEAICLNKEVFTEWINYNYLIAEKFTYTYYNKRIEIEIFEL